MFRRRIFQGAMGSMLVYTFLAACGSDSEELFSPCTGPDCAGPNACDSIVCDTPGPCQSAPGECVEGECIYVPRSGEACDDGDPCTTADACMSGVCVGTPVTCDAPPAASCSDDKTLAVFTAPGLCEDGACVYPSQDTACALGCKDGACDGDPCAGITCNTPPGPCFSAAGSCQNGVCTYPVASGASCDDGDPCTTNDACGSSGVCVGSSLDCQSPPAAKCLDDATLAVYDATGVCDGTGQCTYGSTEVPCEEGCSNGVCNGNPCAGVVCNAPPTPCHQALGTCESGACVYEFDNGANCDDGDGCTEQDTCQAGVCKGTTKVCDTPQGPQCIDENTLRVWASPGQCSGGGQCTYESTDVGCGYGCESGACLGDPCAGVTCDDPGPPVCVSATVLQTPAAQGTCSGGACSYAPTLTTCAYGCVQGACQTPTGLVISELLYNSEGYPDTESFLELHGPAGLSVDGLTLVGVNGNGGNDYATIVLAGNLGSDGLFVVAHPSATGAVAQAADMTHTAVDLQNGPDSVQLRYGSLVLDAVAYGTFEPTDTAAGEGQPVAGHALGESLHRDENFTDTDDNATDFGSASPTPGAPHVDVNCETVLNPGCDCINGSTQPCGSDVGACELGTQTCVEGAWGTCSGGVGPIDEVCGNQVDDDCDGSTDEGCGPEDVFTLGTCGGSSMSSGEALALLGGNARMVLASATIQRRSRSCDTCAWSDPTDWIIPYLTWSGGVSTRYKHLPATMNLVLFNDNGTPRFSIQHTTFVGSTYDDYDGMLYGFPPALIQYPHIRAYNHFPDYQYDYRELDYMARDGKVVMGDDCLQWVADPYGVGGPPYMTGYGVIFRWN